MRCLGSWLECRVADCVHRVCPDPASTWRMARMRSLMSQAPSSAPARASSTPAHMACDPSHRPRSVSWDRTLHASLSHPTSRHSPRLRAPPPTQCRGGPRRWRLPANHTHRCPAPTLPSPPPPPPCHASGPGGPGDAWPHARAEAARRDAPPKATWLSDPATPPAPAEGRRGLLWETPGLPS